MRHENFHHVTTWVFDLDNTLYPPHMRLFDQIERKMTHWVMRNLNLDEVKADLLRAQYWELHGTTLAGLMHEHSIDPLDFLADVHDIDFTVLERDPALADAIASLPGRKIIFTNADSHYAGHVLNHRGLNGLFDAVYGVEHANFRPKPEQAAFDTIIAKDGFDPSKAAMFEDDPRNLMVPHKIGMRTIYVAPNEMAADHIHHHTSDLSGFLRGLTAA